MGYNICAMNTMVATAQEHSASKAPAAAHEVHFSLSPDVDFAPDPTLCEVGDLDFEMLELGYPDDGEENEPKPFNVNTSSQYRIMSGCPVKTELQNAEPAARSKHKSRAHASHYILQPGVPRFFSSSAALVNHLHNRLSAFELIAVGDEPRKAAVFAFHADYDSYPPPGSNARRLARGVRAEVEARCGVRFHAGLPAATIKGSAGVRVLWVCMHTVRVRSEVHVRGGRGEAGTKMVRGILDVSVLLNENGFGRCMTSVQFRLVGCRV
ncbi:hypothetical protein C8R43DRAFT_1242381 [Mycena crocata]|nr:hypothetical protein C8R43DRAFT_1242381 [Mycena crocata]